MKKTVKFTIGILFSALLFYLFIKDVNIIHLAQVSGKGSGVGTSSDRIVYVKDTQGFEPGDKLSLFHQSTGRSEDAVVASVNPKGQDSPSQLLMVAPLKDQYNPQNGDYLKFPRLQKALKNAEYFWLFPALAFTVVALLIRAYRWKFFFPDYKNLSFDGLWKAVCIGYMANNVLPFRMGELIRAWIFSRKEKRGISESFATIVMERVFDILSILVVFVAFIFYFSFKKDVVLPEWLKNGAWVLAVISLVSLGFLIALHFKTNLTLQVFRKIVSPLPGKLPERLMRITESFIQGLSIFSDTSSLLVAFFLSMVIWLDLAIAYYFVFLAVHIHATILISIFLIVGLAFAVSIPSAPGFIGTFHFVGKEVLLIMGLKGNLEAYVLLAHAMAYVPVVLLGFIYLSLEKMSLKDLSRSSNLKEAEARSRLTLS